MAKIHANSKPEIMVRRLLRSAGIGYRLHSPKLPGRPDIIMKGR
ncbi:MAG: very short patch repair endonuclease, partial [Burkholderiales bacterium]|nr:very short patch repair endonuclease [Burkholderiales bacterium]